MASFDAWEHWKSVVLEWLNAFNLEGNRRITFEGLDDGDIFRRVITDVLKVKLETKSTASSDPIQFFLTTEYPAIKLNISSGKRDLILFSSLLIHYWSMRLREDEHKIRESVCTRLYDETERDIRDFLLKLMPENTALITEKHLVKSIESITSKHGKVEESPSTPCSTNRLTTPRAEGSLRHFFASPVARHQNVLADYRRQLREANNDLEREQLEKDELQKKLASQTAKVHKLSSQLKNASDDHANLEQDLLKLRNDNSQRDYDGHIKNFKEEIKTLNSIIADLNSKYLPLEDEKIKLEKICDKLQEAQKLSSKKSSEQELLVKELSEEIKTKDKTLEQLQINYQDLETYVKEMRNDGNNSCDFDTSLTGFSSRFPTSPMPVIDNLPLSTTVVDIQLREKVVEVNELQEQINTANEKIIQIFSKNFQCGPEVGNILLNNLETLANVFKENKEKLSENAETICSLTRDKFVLIEEQRKLSETNQAQDAELLNSQAEIKSLLLRCEDNSKKITELNSVLDGKVKLMIEIEDQRQQLGEKLSELEKKDLELSKTIHILSSELSAFKSANLQLTQSLELTGTKLSETQDVVDSLKLLCDENNTKKTELESIITGKADEIALWTSKQQGLLQELEDTKKLVAEKDMQYINVVEELQTTIANLESTNDKLIKLSDDLHCNETELEKKQLEVDALSLSCASYDKQVAELTSTIGKINKEKVAVDQKREKLSEELSVSREKELRLTQTLQLLETELTDAQSNAEIVQLHCEESEETITELENEIALQSKELSAMTGAKEDLVQQLEGTLQVVSEKEIQIGKLSESLQLAETKLLNSQEQVEALEFCCRDNDKSTAELEISIVEKNKELAVLTSKQGVLLRELEDAKQGLAEKETQINNFIEECDALSSRLYSVIEERSKLTENNHSQQTELLKSRSEVESLLVRCANYDAKIAEMNADINKKVEEFAEINQQRNQLDNELTEMKETEIQLKESLHLLETELSKAREDIETVKLCCSENEKKISEFQKTAAEKHEELSIITRKNTNILQELEESKREVIEKEVLVVQITENLSSTKSDLESFTEECRILTETNRSLGTELLVSQAEITSLLERCEDLNEKVIEMNGQIDRKTENIAEMEQQQELLNNELCIVKNKELLMSEANQVLRENLLRTEGQVETLKLCSLGAEKKIDDLEKSIMEKNAECNVLNGQKEDLHERLETAKQCIAEKGLKIDEVTEFLRCLNLNLKAVTEEKSKLIIDYRFQESELHESKSNIESLLLRCKGYDERVAEMDYTIVKKSELVTDWEQQREILTNELAKVKDNEVHLSDSLHKLESTQQEMIGQVAALELTCSNYKKNTADLEKTIVERSKEFNDSIGKQEVLLREIEIAKQELAAKETRISIFINENDDLRARLNAVIEEGSQLTENYRCQESELLKSHLEVESLLVRCANYDAKIAEMHANINKKAEEFAEIERLRELLSNDLTKTKEKEEHLCDSLQKLESIQQETKVQVAALELSCIEYKKTIAELEKTIVEKNEELCVMLAKQKNLLCEIEETMRASTEKELQINNLTEDLRTVTINLQTVKEEREDFSSQLNNLSANFEEERNKFATEMSSMSEKVSVITKEMESLNEENNHLKKTVDVNDSFCNKCISQVSNILAIDQEEDEDYSNVETAENSHHVASWRLEHLLSRIEEKCKKYRSNLADVKSAVEHSESNWTCQLMRLNEELYSAADREQAIITANAALEERVKAVGVNVAANFKELGSHINELSNLINCADNSVLVNSSALSVSCPGANADGFQCVKSKLSLLRDSISLLVSNKSTLFDDLSLVKEHYIEKKAECELLMSQVHTLTLSCSELKAENLRLQSLLLDSESDRDAGRAENENWKKEYAVVIEKATLLEQKLVAGNFLANCLNMQAEALQIRNKNLMTDLQKKMQDCRDWEKVCFEIFSFKKMIGNRMEYFLSHKSQLDDQLLQIRNKYDDLNSCGLVDSANVEEIESLKSEISSNLFSVEEKLNAMFIDLLNCVYASLHYPYLLIQRQHLNVDSEDVSTNPSISQDSYEAIAKQIKHIETAMEAMHGEVMAMPLKIKRLEDNCLRTSSSSPNLSFLDDSLEEKPGSFSSLSQSKDAVTPAVFDTALLSEVGDPSSAAIRNVMESMVVSQERQFKTLVRLKTESYALDKQNKLGFKQIKEALECKEVLEKKILEQQNSATQLNEAYAVLLKECEHAQSDAKKFSELLAKREEDSKSDLTRTKQLEEKTKQLEEQIKSCYTEEQVEQKVEKLGIEYQGKLERMKVKMGDLFRKETSKFDEMKASACAETEKQCKSEFDNQIRKYKIYVKDQTHEIDDLKGKLHQKNMESTFLSKQLDRLEKREDARNSSLLKDPLEMRRDSVLGHLQRRVEPARVMRTHTATSTTVERDLDPAGSYYRRQSISTQKSISSLHSMHSESFAVEDEEGEVFNNTYLGDLKAGYVPLPEEKSGPERLGELQYRNSLCPPHLKSSYPAETQFHDPHSFRDEDVKLGFGSEINQSDTSSLSALLLPGERQRKRDRGKNQTSYQKPGPPTPIKNGGRRSLQGGELLSPRAALREVNDGAALRKVSTPNRIRALFSTKSKRDENSPMTPRARRLSLFRKSARGREDC